MSSSSFQWQANSEAPPPHDPSLGGLFTTATAGTGKSLTPLASTYSPTSTNTNTTTNIQPTAGDDLSPPNAVSYENLNGIAFPVSASAGWSTSPPRQHVYPSNIEYHLQLLSNNDNNNDTLQVQVILEYTNPYHANEETMMIKLQMTKCPLQQQQQPLDLVETQFQEYTNHQWIDIRAHVDYTHVANTVVDAVLRDDQNQQTAGKTTVTAKTIDAILGPFSNKARVLWTFQTDAPLYSYDAMTESTTTTAAAAAAAHRILPLWTVLPFAPVDHPAGLSRLHVRLSVPRNAQLLPVQAPAYGHLHQQLQQDATVLAVSELSSSSSDRRLYQQTWESLPPRSCGILAWLVLPYPPNDDDFVDLGRLTLNTSLQATLKVPVSTDALSLQVPLPGHGPLGRLYRLHVPVPKTGAEQKQRRPLWLLHATLSDRSGSTARQVVSNRTMRECFNELAVVRFWKRLESIPALVQAGVMQLGDVWMEVFVGFDHAASIVHKVVFGIDENVVAGIAGAVEQMRSGSNDSALTATFLPLWEHVQALRAVTPGGATDFAVGPKLVVQEYTNWQTEAMSLLAAAKKKVIPCTFVEFDTDGGHNSGPSSGGDYQQALLRLCETCHVRNGVVTGFGSWLNQDCATKVARILGPGNPAQLALEVPAVGQEGWDPIFRKSFAAWVGALRQRPPVKVQLSAGSVQYKVGGASRSVRNSNGMEVLALRRTGVERYEALPTFGPPDVSEEEYTKTVVENVPPGDELLFYIVSRLETASQLASALEIRVIDEGEDDDSSTVAPKARVMTEAETVTGSFLAYDWLRVLSDTKGCEHSLLMATSLATRLEDEVSFRFDIASPSGRTSYLGRRKTATNRAAIDADHQAPEPQSIDLFSLTFFASTPFGPPSSLFGAPVGTLSGFGTPAPALQPSGGSASPPSFGFASPAPPSQLTFGSSAPAHAGPTVAAAGFGSSTSSSGGLFGSSPTPAASVGITAPTSPAPAVSFGSSTPAQGGLFGSVPASGSFGSSTPAPGGIFGSAPAFGSGQTSPAPFGAPAPVIVGAGSTAPALGGALFGSSTGLSQSNHPKTTRDKPLWVTAMTIPVGSGAPSKQDFEKLKTAIGEVALAQQLLRGDPNIRYFCDNCRRQLQPDEDRFHCLNCDGYDLCFNCRDSHVLPFHQVRRIERGFSTQNSPPVEDPLVATMLQPTQPASSKRPPETDQTLVSSTSRVQRFLFSVLHWWPLFRATCSFCDRLPATLPEDLARKIRDASTVSELLETATIIIDSLVREASK